MTTDEGRRERVIKGTVASPRIDALGSIGFGLSRTRMAREIRAERLQLNGTAVTDPAKTAAPEDVIVLEGRGGVIIEELSGPTRRGRIGVTVRRYYST